jgi:hypothetical protein
MLFTPQVESWYAERAVYLDVCGRQLPAAVALLELGKLMTVLHVVKSERGTFSETGCTAQRSSAQAHHAMLHCHVASGVARGANAVDSSAVGRLLKAGRLLLDTMEALGADNGGECIVHL